MQAISKFVLLFMVSAFINGCATLNSFFLGESETREPASVPSPDNTSVGDLNVLKAAGALPGDVESPKNLGANEFAQLQRNLDDSARRGYRSGNDPWQGTGNEAEGSLWSPNSQFSFLFTKNLKYSVGDFLYVEVSPDLQETLNSRLAKLYEPKASVRKVTAAEVGKAVGQEVGDAAEKAIGNKAIADAVGSEAASKAYETLKGQERYFTTTQIPVRVTEVATDGTLRISGQKQLFLKYDTFEIKIAGMIREGDINPSQVIQSSSIMEAKVELRK